MGYKEALLSMRVDAKR